MSEISWTFHFVV